MALHCHKMINEVIEIEEVELNKTENLKKFYMVFGILILIFCAYKIFTSPEDIYKFDFDVLGKNVDPILKVGGSLFGVFVTGLGVASPDSVRQRKKDIVLMRAYSGKFENMHKMEGEELANAQSECEKLIGNISSKIVNDGK